MDMDYIGSIIASLIVYGLVCVAAGYWLRRGIDRAFREILSREEK